MNHRSNHARWRLPAIVVPIAISATVGFFMSSTVHWAIVGALLGFIVGWNIAGFISPYDGTLGIVKAFPTAIFGLVLSAASWVAMIVIWGWVFARDSAFHNEAGMFVLFIIIPLTAFFWLIGGPTAGAAARYALRQLQAGTRPESDRSLATKAIFLSRALTLAFVGGVLLLFVSLAG